MPNGAKADIKFGFYAGIGVAIALMLLSFLQLLTLRAVNRSNG